MGDPQGDPIRRQPPGFDLGDTTYPGGRTDPAKHPDFGLRDPYAPYDGDPFSPSGDPPRGPSANPWGPSADPQGQPADPFGPLLDPFAPGGHDPFRGPPGSAPSAFGGGSPLVQPTPIRPGTPSVVKSQPTSVIPQGLTFFEELKWVLEYILEHGDVPPEWTPPFKRPAEFDPPDAGAGGGGAPSSVGPHGFGPGGSRPSNWWIVQLIIELIRLIRPWDFADWEPHFDPISSPSYPGVPSPPSPAGWGITVGASRFLGFDADSNSFQLSFVKKLPSGKLVTIVVEVPWDLDEASAFAGVGFDF